ncbi:hypothetical protein BDQ17DRAFT_1436248 [Cyathus striatus]|nr:hypothetical protein BDQ17DRAFT_1436248 [Cyathus striatus]
MSLLLPATHLARGQATPLLTLRRLHRRRISMDERRSIRCIPLCTTDKCLDLSFPQAHALYVTSRSPRPISRLTPSLPRS